MKKKVSLNITISRSTRDAIYAYLNPIHGRELAQDGRRITTISSLVEDLLLRHLGIEPGMAMPEPDIIQQNIGRIAQQTLGQNQTGLREAIHQAREAGDRAAATEALTMQTALGIAGAAALAGHYTAAEPDEEWDGFDEDEETVLISTATGQQVDPATLDPDRTPAEQGLVTVSPAQAEQISAADAFGIEEDE